MSRLLSERTLVADAVTVAAAGPGVRAVREGDRVAVFGAWGCGYCNYCVTGHEQLCEAPQWAGVSDRDGYAEYLLVPHERSLVRLSRLDPAEAAPLTDAALTPYRAIKKALPCLKPNHYVLLVGVGGLGQYALKLLRLFTGSPVIAVDVSEDKLRVARELGAVHALNGKAPDRAARIRGITEGRGVGGSFDCVGTDATLSLWVGTTRSLGKIKQIGLAGGTARLKVLENSRFEVPFEGTIKELREVIALAESGQLTSIPIERASLERITDVYARLKRGDVAGRAVMVPHV